jgi:glycerophosphoryl diester phosphodiesterase
VFIVLHDVILDNTTNVATFPEYADRKAAKLVDGVNMTGFFVSDFLLSELKSLRLLQRIPQRTKLYNGMFQIPTLTEVIKLVQDNFNRTQYTIGMYIEMKHPSYFHELGYAMEGMLLSDLHNAGYNVYKDHVSNNLFQVNPITLECFDDNSLRHLNKVTDLPLVQLVEKQPTTFWTTGNMQNIAIYADAVGPEKSYFENLSYSDALQAVDMIYSVGLRMHPWTFRADQDIGSMFQGDFQLEEIYLYCCLGIDAVFSEFPDRTRETLKVLRDFTELAPRAPGSTNTCPIDCNAPAAGYKVSME